MYSCAYGGRHLKQRCGFRFAGEGLKVLQWHVHTLPQYSEKPRSWEPLFSVTVCKWSMWSDWKMQILEVILRTVEHCYLNYTDRYNPFGFLRMCHCAVAYHCTSGSLGRIWWVHDVSQSRSIILSASPTDLPIDHWCSSAAHCDVCSLHSHRRSALHFLTSFISRLQKAHEWSIVSVPCLLLTQP